MLKKITLLSLVVACIAGCLSFIAIQPAAAQVSTSLFSASTCNKPRLLGILVPWYQYLDVENDSVTGGCAVADFQVLPGGGQPSDIPLVLLAIVDDLLRIAAIAAVIFIIYGGVTYTTSQGEPDAAAKAQHTIINAVIGLVIAITAVVFVAFLGKALT